MFVQLNRLNWISVILYQMNLDKGLKLLGVFDE